MMTKHEKMVDKTTMEKEYSRDELVVMFRAIQQETGLSQDACAKKLDIAKHRVKDWMREKTFDINRHDAKKIIDCYHRFKAKEIASPLHEAREKLDSSIMLWSEKGATGSIVTLASKAYEEFLALAEENKKYTPFKKPEIPEKNPEAYIFFSLSMLLILNEPLNRTELAYLSSLAYSESDIFLKKSRIPLDNIVPIKDKKISRNDFFRQLLLGEKSED